MTKLYIMLNAILKEKAEVQKEKAELQRMKEEIDSLIKEMRETEKVAREWMSYCGYNNIEVEAITRRMKFKLIK